ncbi:MAG: formylmethanofuran--tetrahydromethanopterin N-formyltransferase [Planctomycetaceae bacterium]|nr:formylmethanofuran--tetrahydromethanopterin N-formyltransferase [Planctomycetaceae bacterium]
MTVEIEDTYAEAFRSLYVEILITARDRQWLDHAINAATGHASSSIMCDCESGLDRYVGPGGDESFQTPDGRPGAICQLHVPRFWKPRVEKLEQALLARVSQNVLTCPTARCFAPEHAASENYFRLGRKVAYFGGGFERLASRHGRDVWLIPTMGGDFYIDRRFPYHDGVMGGNLWFMADSVDASLSAAERAVAACQEIPGVITPFPGGVAASGSKAGSRYKFLFASTNERFCPTLRDQQDVTTELPDGVESAMEIIINGTSLEAISAATQAAISAASGTPGLVKISAGNYGGRLGKSWVWLIPENHPVESTTPTT